MEIVDSTHERNSKTARNFATIFANPLGNYLFIKARSMVKY